MDWAWWLKVPTSGEFGAAHNVDTSLSNSDLRICTRSNIPIEEFRQTLIFKSLNKGK